ncbi:hypothetical protein B0H16DRAFT_582845, partial [Mycena metata]
MRTSNGSLRLPCCIVTLRLHAGIVSASLTKGRQIHTGCPPWRTRTSPNLIHTSPPAPFISPSSLSLDLRLRTRPCYRAPPLLVPASTPAPSSRLEVVPAPALKRSRDLCTPHGPGCGHPPGARTYSPFPLPTQSLYPYTPARMSLLNFRIQSHLRSYCKTALSKTLL